MKAYHYCITIKRNDDDINDFDKIWNEDKMRYLIVGMEISSDGYKHWQIYIQLFKQYRMKGIKTLFNDNTAHCEVQKGTNSEARDYCWKGQYEKSGTRSPQPSAIIREFGTFTIGQGARTELDDIKKDIDDGLGHYTIVQDQKKFNSYARYHSWFYKYKQMVDDDRHNIIRVPVKVNVIHGECATGKTTSILNKEGVKNCYILKNPNGDNKNWNGYNDQKILIIDDFYGWLPLNEMLRILDNKPYRVRKLGDYTWAKWNTIYITANSSPLEWYDIENEEVMEAFYSRLSKCLEVTRGNTGTLVAEFKDLPNRGRNDKKEYLNIDGLF